MSKTVLIFGKDACPYTTNAREGYAGKGCSVTYHDVQKDKNRLGEMLKFSKGDRRVPVIVEGEKVTIGYGGT